MDGTPLSTINMSNWFERELMYLRVGVGVNSARCRQRYSALGLGLTVPVHPVISVELQRHLSQEDNRKDNLDPLQTSLVPIRHAVVAAHKRESVAEEAD